MKAKDALIAWTPTHGQRATRGQVQVGPLLHDGDPDWTAPYAYTGGAANVERRKMTGWQAVAMLFIEFNTLVMRDGISPEAAHKAFLLIDEYAEKISPDTDGARG